MLSPPLTISVVVFFTTTYFICLCQNNVVYLWYGKHTNKNSDPHPRANPRGVRDPYSPVVLRSGHPSVRGGDADQSQRP